LSVDHINFLYYFGIFRKGMEKGMDVLGGHFEEDNFSSKPNPSIAIYII